MRVLRQVADALDYAHGQGIVHRDVKPGNIPFQDDHAVVRDVDGRSDVYSLGYVALEMLAGQPPFSGTRAQIIAKRFTTAPPSLRAHRPEFPTDVDCILAKALALMPAERYQTATAFADALSDALARRAAVTTTHAAVVRELPSHDAATARQWAMAAAALSDACRCSPASPSRW